MDIQRDPIEEIRIKKAENELLDQALETIRNHYKGTDNEERVRKLEAEINQSKEFNYQIAEAGLMVRRSDVDNAQFREDGKYHTTMEQHKKNLVDGLKRTENDLAYGIKITDIEIDDGTLDDGTIKVDEYSVTYDPSYEIEEVKYGTDSVRYKVETDSEVDIYDQEYLDKSYTDFDFSSIKHTNYDMIPLPSNGQCYPHKRSKIPVAYLTASDENIILSPNLYRDGKVVDILLKRKILDPTIKVEELCVADKDAILLFLRANGYGVELPLTVTDPKDGSQHNVNVNLGDFKAREFTLKGDENGWFDYTMGNGDKIKFNFLTHAQDNFISKEYAKEIELQNNLTVRESLKFVGDKIKQIRDIDENVRKAYSILNKWVDKLDDNQNDYYVSEALTLSTFYMIREVNGNRDRKFIKEYVNNLRVIESKKFREYIAEHVPMIDFSFEVKRKGRGGSFKTFLEFSHYILLNT